MKRPASDQFPLLLPVLVALYVVVQITATWTTRVAYPYDLEWMEGGVLAHAWRVQHALPLYAEPSADFIPMVYTPGYYYVLAALGWVVGLTHSLGRVVSILGTLAASAALITGATRRLGRPELGLVGAAVYLGCYEHSGAFYDMVRPDALAVGLAAWAAVLSTESSQRARDVGAALLFAAFVTKHNMAAFGVPLAVGLWAAQGWREALRFGLLAAVPGLLYTLFMNLTTDGHFLTYILTVPRSHPMVWNRVVPGTVRETGGALPIVLAAVSLWSLSLGPRVAPRIPVPLHVVLPVLAGAASMAFIGGMDPVPGIPMAEPWQAQIAGASVGILVATACLALLGQLLDRRAHAPWILGAGTVAVMFFVAGVMRGHHGGFVNVFMPWDWVLAALFVVLLADTLDQLPGWQGAGLVALLATAQLGLQVQAFDLARLEPTADDVAAGDRVVADLAEVDGPVLSPFAPWLPAQAGHAPGFHLIALWDIRHKGGPYEAFAERIPASIRDQHWGAVLDAKESMGMGVARHYTTHRTFTFAGRDLMPRTGWRRRPVVLWVPASKGQP